MVENIIGKKFNHLTVVEKTEKRSGGKIVYKCICDCENIHIVRGGHLRNGYVQSCGCLQKETVKKYNDLRHKYKTKSLKKSKILY